MLIAAGVLLAYFSNKSGVGAGRNFMKELRVMNRELISPHP